MLLIDPGLQFADAGFSIAWNAKS